MSDPYAALAEALARLKKPLQDLQTTHDDFVLQGVRAVNNVELMRDLRIHIQRGRSKSK